VPWGSATSRRTKCGRAHAALARRGIPLASNQVQYSLLHRRPEVNGVLDTCRELGVTLIAYMPLASGALTGKHTATNRPPGFRRYMSYFRGRTLTVLSDLLRLLDEIGSRYDKTPSQVALRWLIQQESVLPIPGAKNPQTGSAQRWSTVVRINRRRSECTQRGHASSLTAASARQCDIAGAPS